MATSDIKKGPLYVDSTNSRVGIGTSSPTQATLHVDGGSVPARFESTSASTSYVQFGASGTTNYGQVAMTGNDMTLRTSYTDRMTIDSSGRVTMPYNPAFGAYTDGTNINLTTFRSTTNVIQFNRIGGATWTFDRGSNFNTSTYTFTAPVAGVYMFYTRLQLNNMSCTNNDWAVNLHFQVNGGGNYANGYYTATIVANDGPDYHIHEKVAHINLNANDGVRVAMSGNSTVQGTLETQTSDGRCYFSGHLVS